MFAEEWRVSEVCVGLKRAAMYLRSFPTLQKIVPQLALSDLQGSRIELIVLPKNSQYLGNHLILPIIGTT